MTETESMNLNDLEGLRDNILAQKICKNLNLLDHLNS